MMTQNQWEADMELCHNRLPWWWSSAMERNKAYKSYVDAANKRKEQTSV